jgi:hypothetical protein
MPNSGNVAWCSIKISICRMQQGIRWAKIYLPVEAPDAGRIVQLINFDLLHD